MRCTSCLGIVVMAAAVMGMGGAAFAALTDGGVSGVRALVVAIAGPPAAAMEERYAGPGGATFDHSTLDRLLRAHVSEAGFVDYAGLLKDREALQAYLRQLATVDFAGLSRDAKLALLINAYNAFTLELILDHWDGGALASIYDIPEAQRWDAKRWRLAGQTVSLNQIEHAMIREDFREPRIHWALVCAAVSCPPLRAEAYTAEKLDAQLADHAARVHAGRWVRYDASANVLHLTPLYEWYGGDFEKTHGSVLGAVAEQVPAVRAALDRGERPTIDWLEYDWTLNDVRAEP